MGTQWIGMNSMQRDEPYIVHSYLGCFHFNTLSLPINNDRYIYPFDAMTLACSSREKICSMMLSFKHV